MSKKEIFVFTLRRNVAYDEKHAAIYDKLKTNAHSPFHGMYYTKTFITAMSIGIKYDSCIELDKPVRNVPVDVFTDIEKWMIYAQFMKENPKLGVKSLFEPDAMLDLAEKYANGGIEKLNKIYEETSNPLDALEDELRKHLK